MTNYGRGTYEPPGDDMHIFDASEDDMDDEGSRLPLLIVIALFVIAAFAGVVWLAYTQGVARGRSDVPRVIAAEPGPAKVAANGEEGAATPYKGLKIYEQPAPADEEADHQVTPPPPSPSTNTEAAAPDTVAVTPYKPESAPVKTETPQKTEVAAIKPAQAPAVKLVAPPPVKATPAPAAPAPATAPPAQLSAKTNAGESSGAYLLQIGAYKSEEEALAAWRTYQARHATTLSGYAPDTKKVDLGEKGTWYRLRVGTFADKTAAKVICDKLTAEGGDCFPTK